ncbi:hypothetical protein BsWGS_00435 [Bradybaena similaris]
MADGTSIDFVEQRISALESLVFGAAEKDAEYPKDGKAKGQCIDGMLEIQGKIQTALSGKKKATLLYEKLPELKMYLDHAYTDEMMLSEDARTETVLAEAEFLEQQSVLLQKLSENQTHINSEHIQAVPKLADKLQTLSRLHIDQQDEVAHLTEETRRLLSAYNNIVTLLSKQFLMWDETLTQLEVKAASKK